MLQYSEVARVCPLRLRGQRTKHYEQDCAQREGRDQPHARTGAPLIGRKQVAIDRKPRACTGESSRIGQSMEVEIGGFGIMARGKHRGLREQCMECGWFGFGFQPEFGPGKAESALPYGRERRRKYGTGGTL